MLENEALVALAEAEVLGNEALVPFLKAKMEVTKKYFVSTAGHSKQQKIVFEKISSIFFVLFSDALFPKTSRRWGETIFFFGLRIRFRAPKERYSSQEWVSCFLGLENPFS